MDERGRNERQGRPKGRDGGAEPALGRVPRFTRSRDRRPGLRGAGCCRKLEIRDGHTAVDYYTGIVAPGGFLAREQYLVRVDLAGFDEELKDRDSQEYPAVIDALRKPAEAKPWNFIPTVDARAAS